MARKAFDKIMAGLADAVEIQAGRADPATYRIHAPASIDVRRIRKARGLSQQQFAACYGFTLGRVRDWEQGRSQPEPPIRILLTLIDKEPEAVARAVG